MGLILKDKLQALMVGHPTVSDKYNVGGGILSGSSAAKFGSLVKVTATPGYYEPAAGASSAAKIAGFILATNVKLAQEWPGTTVQVNPGEAFNLLINGFIAAELDSGATFAAVAAVAAVGAASTDTAVNAEKTYYTRASSTAGAGLLNDGAYAYTAVAAPTGNPSTSSYYELSVLGANAIADAVIPNAQVYIILATGKLTTSDKAAEGTIVPLTGYIFTGYKELHGSAKIAEIYVK